MKNGQKEQKRNKTLLKSYHYCFLQELKTLNTKNAFSVTQVISGVKNGKQNGKQHHNINVMDYCRNFVGGEHISSTEPWQRYTESKQNK